MGFAVTAISVGWVRALTEVYEITPTSSVSCKLRWTFAVSFPGLLGRLAPVVGRILPLIQSRLLNTLERVARERSTQPRE